VCIAVSLKKLKQEYYKHPLIKAEYFANIEGSVQQQHKELELS